MDTTSLHRTGPKMRLAALYVAQHPGCAILPVAEHVGPNGSRRYGYAIVWRAIRAGMIVAERVTKGYRYSLSIPKMVEP